MQKGVQLGQPDEAGGDGRVGVGAARHLREPRVPLGSVGAVLDGLLGVHVVEAVQRGQHEAHAAHHNHTTTWVWLIKTLRLNDIAYVKGS